MNRLHLRVSEDAARELREARDWWEVNRPAAPDALLINLRRALELVRTHPQIGTRASNVRLERVRRVHLGRLRFDFYYRVSTDGAAIEVIAFWHSSRGAGPPV